MRAYHRLAGAILLLLALPAYASAQEAGAAPYDSELLRLAEVLGGLHHLRAVCGSNEGMLWRDKMLSLLEAEAPTGERRERLAGAFNAGYRAYARSYTSCTPAAQVVIRRFLGEGARIARDVAGRYSN
jgi:uncharacterized protein (TIGR02301 family)